MDVLRKFFYNKEGELTILQMPNIPIMIWLASSVFARVYIDGLPHTILSWVASLALAYWALLEITRGANYFRRIIGITVLIGLIYLRVTR